MPLEDEELLAGLGVPHMHRWISVQRRTTSGHQPFAVRAESQAESTVLNGEEFLAGLIPQLHLAPDYGCQPFAVRAESQAVKIVLNGEEFLTGFEVPDYRFAAGSSGCQAFAVRAEG